MPGGVAGDPRDYLGPLCRLGGVFGTGNMRDLLLKLVQLAELNTRSEQFVITVRRPMGTRSASAPRSRTPQPGPLVRFGMSRRSRSRRAAVSRSSTIRVRSEYSRASTTSPAMPPAAPKGPTRIPLGFGPLGARVLPTRLRACRPSLPGRFGPVFGSGTSTPRRLDELRRKGHSLLKMGDCEADSTAVGQPPPHYY
jgi:hypothetical protein